MDGPGASDGGEREAAGSHRASGRRRRAPGALVLAGITALGLLGACETDPTPPGGLVMPEGAPAPLFPGPEVTCVAPAAAPLPFVDHTEAAGIAFQPRSPPWDGGENGYSSVDLEIAGGIVMGDLDGDGQLDLIFADLEKEFRYFRGRTDGGFDVINSQWAGLPQPPFYIQGLSMVDLDGDRDLDLYALARETDYVLINDGSGRFADRSEAWGLTPELLRGASASWADFDRDGDLDGFVANHGSGSMSPGDESFPHRDALLVQQDHGAFTDPVAWLYPENWDGFGFVGGWFDADNDGWLDLLVANDLGGENGHAGNVFVHNDGVQVGTDWGFTREDGHSLEVAVHAMGLALGDFDRDGDMDVHVTNAGPTWLGRNDLDAGFVDVSLPLVRYSDGSEGDISWTTWFLDHGNDLAQDLFIGYGYMPTKVDRGPNQTVNRLEMPDRLLRWDGVDWTNIAPEVGVANPASTRTAIVADVDRNGFEDLLTWSLDLGPRLYLQSCDHSRWLRVVLEQGGTKNRFAVGARVEAWSEGAYVIMRDMQAGSQGTQAVGPPEVHLGLGDLEVVDLVVRWPDGLVTVNEGVPTAREVVVHHP